MRRTSISVWCDLCPERATHPGIPISIDETELQTLDLCDEHYQRLLGPVLLALDYYGRAPAKPDERPDHRQGWKRKIGPFQCLAGCQSAPLKNASTLEAHLRRLHDMRLDEYVEKYGELVPLAAGELEPVVVECEVEGCDQTYSSEQTRWPQQAMVSHMRGRHGINWRPGRGVIGAVGESTT